MFNSRAKKLIGEDGDVPLIGYCYTAAAARGRGLYRRALLAEMGYLQHRGYKRVVIDTHPANQASRKGIEAAGFQFLRTVSVWIVLNLFALQRTEAGHDTRWRMLFL
jgi:RimJ/RimL family protein N-acetyltransferase